MMLPDISIILAYLYYNICLIVIRYMIINDSNNQMYGYDYDL